MVSHNCILYWCFCGCMFCIVEVIRNRHILCNLVFVIVNVFRVYVFVRFFVCVAVACLSNP